MAVCRAPVWILLTAVALLAAGCGGVTIIGGSDEDIITVRAINNTDFDVDPNIEYGTSRNSLRGLDLGILAPGEAVEADFTCDEIEVLTSTDSTQLGLTVDYVLDPLPLFEIDEDYFCGELVEFEFFGSGQDFAVAVDAGGENIF
jgi:hypothetical protein